ncbi:MAG: RNA pseudouridine synthase [Desulfobacterales bacterium]|nr:RNA pseudouridine synthase [Desulfobacterales bacterium]
MIVNKPHGIPTGYGKQHNLCELVFYDFPELAEVTGFHAHEGGLLNRLDNDTGGIVLFAKNQQAFSYYSQLMKEEKIEKSYTALVQGCPTVKKGVIYTPIAHHPRNTKKMVAVTHDNIQYRGRKQSAQTSWEVIESNCGYALIKIRIKKGRRHQIRVHLASIGCPIVGDKLYNKTIYSFSNHLLFANGIDLMNMDQQQIHMEVNVPFQHSLTTQHFL